MPTAFTPLSAGTVLSSIAAGSYIAQCRTGAEQRLRALCGDTYDCPPIPAAGDPCLSAAFWGQYPGHLTHPNRYAIQEVIAGTVIGPTTSLSMGRSTLLQQYIDHRGPLVIEGAPTLYGSVPTWASLTNDNMSALRTAASLPSTRHWTYDPGANTMTEDATKANHLFLRKRRRMITALTAARDDQGNAAATGQVAYGSGGGGTLAGDHYRCVVSGTWVHDESAGMPDLLSNDQAAPNTVAEVISGGGSGYGAVQPGDCFGEWIINEVMACLDLMRWVVLPGFFFGFTSGADPRQTINYIAADQPAGLTDSSDALAQASRAAAVAVVAAGWGTTASPNTDINVFGSIINHSAGFSYDAHAVKAAASYLPVALLSALDKKWYYYIWADDYGTDTFNDNGDAVLDSQYHDFSDSGGVPSAATAPASGLLGNIATVPVIPPDPGPGPFGTDNTATTGYQARDILMVCKYNVTGGFDRCSVTD